MAQARFKDLVCLVVDVGPTAHECVPGWLQVVQRIVVNRMMNASARQHELALLTFGSKVTNHDLAKAPGTSGYPGVDVISEFRPCTPDLLEKLPDRIIPGNTPADFFDALVVAADLLKRTVSDRKLTTARKTIVIASPFTTALPEIGEDPLRAIHTSLDEIGAPVISAGIATYAAPSLSQEAASAVAVAAKTFHMLHKLGFGGSVVDLLDATELCGLVKSHSLPAFAACALKVHEFELSVKVAKVVTDEKMPSLKPYYTPTSNAGEGASTSAAAAAAEALPNAQNFLRRETTWTPKTDEAMDHTAQDRLKMYSFGSSFAPFPESEAYKWTAEADFKGIQVLCFVKDTLSPARSGQSNDAAEDEMEEEEATGDVPFAQRRSLFDGAHVVMPATAKAAKAVSALVRAMRGKRRAAAVRYVLRANSAMSLGVLVPVQAHSAKHHDHFFLFKVPWSNEFLSLQTEVFTPDSVDAYGISEEVNDSIEAFVEASTDPRPFLPGDRCCDPIHSRLDLHLVNAELARRNSAAADVLPLFREDPFVARTLLRSDVAAAAAQSLEAMFPSLLTSDANGAGNALEAIKNNDAGKEDVSEKVKPDLLLSQKDREMLARVKDEDGAAELEEYIAQLQAEAAAARDSSDPLHARIKYLSQSQSQGV